MPPPTMTTRAWVGKFVLDVFADGVQKEHDHYITNNPPSEIKGRENKKLSEKYILYRFVNLYMRSKVNKRGSQTEAFRKYKELKAKRDIELGEDAIKQIKKLVNLQ